MKFSATLASTLLVAAASATEQLHSGSFHGPFGAHEPSPVSFGNNFAHNGFNSGPFSEQ